MTRSHAPVGTSAERGPSADVPSAGEKAHRNRSPRPDWQSRAAWFVIGLLVLVQYGLFRQFAEREVVWAPPQMTDQNTYLTLSYEAYEGILAEGPVNGIAHAFWQTIPNGALIHAQAPLLFLLLGPSRLSALTLNFAYFIGLQLTVVGTLRWLTRGWSAAFLGLGILLTAQTPFIGAGGLMDFRIDFIAACLYGILIGFAVRSDLFASWKWASACGAVAVLLVLFRFITAAYLVALGGALFFVLLAQLGLGRLSAEVRRRTCRRFVGLAIVGGMLLVFCAPVLWHNRHVIHDYYVIRHVTGPEKEIREQEFGIFSQADALLYYPRSVCREHTGRGFWIISGALLAGATLLAAGRVFQRRGQFGPVIDAHTRRFDWFSVYSVLVLSLVVPLAVLTLDRSKSPVVGDVAVGPAVWLMAVTVVLLTGLDRGPRSGLVGWGTHTLAAGALGMGLMTQASHLTPRGELGKARPEVEQVSDLFDQIGKECKFAGWSAPRIASTSLNPNFLPMIAEVLVYEKQGVLLHPQTKMPLSVLAVNEAEATAAIDASDFVIFSHNDADGHPFYPFVQSIQTLRPKLLPLCERSFLPVGQYCVFGEVVTLYKRPSVRIEGNDSDGWVTDRGLVIRGSRGELRRFPHLELNGKSCMTLFARQPKVQAQLITGEAGANPVRAALTSVGDAYQIRVDLEPAELSGEGQAEVRLAFDSSFVPREVLSGNPDPRRLVLMKPVEAVLHP